MNSLKYGDILSSDYDVWISGTGTFSSPTRDIETVVIPGRSGDLVRDNNRFQNIEVTYPAFISRKFQTRFDDFRAAMLSSTGYQRLEDTYHQDEYRMALFTGPLNPTTTAWNRAGSFDLTFNCKPQRFLKLGEQAITMTASGTLWNPTRYDAKPFIRAYGTGTVTINGYPVTISYASTYTDIDCELQDAYKGSVNCNGYVTLEDYEYPVLSPGANTVTISGFTSVEITPRWWTI